jgi:hypothetical protein
MAGKVWGENDLLSYLLNLYPQEIAKISFSVKELVLLDNVLGGGY